MNKNERLEKFNVEIAIDMMRHGFSQKQIGKEMGLTGQQISACFKDLGITFIRRTSYINDEFFDEMDTEEKAYILGFLVADGCVKHEIRKTKISYRIAFCNAIDDAETIKLIHDLICPDKALITNTPKGRKKASFILQWTSEHMAKTLENKYNIKPRKTYDSEFEIPKDAIPEHLWRHFIRGYFDGDGHVSYNTVEFVFNSEKFMHQVLKYFSKFNYRIYKVDGKECVYYKVVITGGRSLIHYTKDLFYSNARYYLSRKFKQFDTEISDYIADRVIDIVEHRAE